MGEKISEAALLKKGLEMIMDIAQGMSESLDGEQSDSIFKIAHTLHAPGCRKNHISWTGKIKLAIRAAKKDKVGRKDGR